MTHTAHTLHIGKTFRIAEQACTGKRPAEQQTPDSLCEDGIAVGADFAAVVDGSTSKGSLRVGGKTSGRLAMEILTDAVANDLAPTDDMRQAADKLTARVRRFYEANGLCDEALRHPENRLTASLVVYSARRHEVWFMGDCQCRFGGTTYTHPKPTDSLLSAMRCSILRHLVSKGHSIAALQARDLGREWIWPFLKDQCAFQNATDAGPFGYAVIDGFPPRTDLMRRLPLPESLSELVLASDGYPVVCDTLEASERELSRLLAEDPLCMGEHPSTKGLKPGNTSFDDRTYLRLAFIPQHETTTKA